MMQENSEFPEDTVNIPLTSTAKPRALGAFGFASFMRSGFEEGDEEMVARKFETLGHRIEKLELTLMQLAETFGNPKSLDRIEALTNAVKVLQESN